MMRQILLLFALSTAAFGQARTPSPAKKAIPKPSAVDLRIPNTDDIEPVIRRFQLLRKAELGAAVRALQICHGVFLRSSEILRLDSTQRVNLKRKRNLKRGSEPQWYDRTSSTPSSTIKVVQLALWAVLLPIRIAILNMTPTERS